MVYTKEQVEVSHKALNEISETFNRSKNLQKKFILTGGWAPYFITLGKFEPYWFQRHRFGTFP